MRPLKNKLQLLLLPLALCGFAVAQPIYNLLLQTPVFLVARQNTVIDVWALVLILSFVLPVVLVLPALLTHRRWPVFSSWWCWIVSSVFAVLFVAQLLQENLGAFWLLYIGLAVVSGIAIAWVLLFWGQNSPPKKKPEHPTVHSPRPELLQLVNSGLIQLWSAMSPLARSPPPAICCCISGYRKNHQAIGCDGLGK